MMWDLIHPTEVTLKVVPCKDASECLRVFNATTGSDVGFADTEEATEFLKLWFNWDDERIKEYRHIP